jgi:hypothetical protein
VAKKKRKSANARLKARIQLEPNPWRIVGESYWRDPKNWAAAAVAALNPETLDRPTKLAFEALKLDPLSPHDWRTLLEALASIHFNVGKGGKPKVRRDSDLCRLLADYYQVWARNPTQKPRDVRSAMIRDKSFAGRFWFGKAPETLRRNLGQALSSTKNKHSKLIKEMTESRLWQVRGRLKKITSPGRSVTSFLRAHQHANF